MKALSSVLLVALLAGCATQGAAGGQGLRLPTYFTVADMGGGQGLTVEVYQGTVGALGLADARALRVLGDPKSFIN